MRQDFTLPARRGNEGSFVMSVILMGDLGAAADTRRGLARDLLRRAIERSAKEGSMNSDTTALLRSAVAHADIGSRAGAR